MSAVLSKVFGGKKGGIIFRSNSRAFQVLLDASLNGDLGQK